MAMIFKYYSAYQSNMKFCSYRDELVYSTPIEVTGNYTKFLSYGIGHKKRIIAVVLVDEHHKYSRYAGIFHSVEHAREPIRL